MGPVIALWWDLTKISQICTFEVVNVQTCNVFLLTDEASHALQSYPWNWGRSFEKYKATLSLLNNLAEINDILPKKKNTILSASSWWPCCGWTKSSAAENFVETGLLKRLISLKIGRLLGRVSRGRNFGNFLSLYASYDWLLEVLPNLWSPITAGRLKLFLRSTLNIAYKNIL